MLQGLVSGLVEVQKDSNGVIFLDPNVNYFEQILNLLREAEKVNPS
jgi:hypothetical protein